MHSTQVKTSTALWSIRTTVVVGLITSTLFLITFYLLMQVLMIQQAQAKEVVFNAIHNSEVMELSGEAVDENHYLHFIVKEVHPVYEVMLQQSVNGEHWKTVSVFNNERLLKMVKNGSFIHTVSDSDSGLIYRTMMRCKVGWVKSESINLGSPVVVSK
jgi:hypothetical protein